MQVDFDQLKRLVDLSPEDIEQSRTELAARRRNKQQQSVGQSDEVVSNLLKELDSRDQQIKQLEAKLNNLTTVASKHDVEIEDYKKKKPAIKRIATTHGQKKLAMVDALARRTIPGTREDGILCSAWSDVVPDETEGMVEWYETKGIMEDLGHPQEKMHGGYPHYRGFKWRQPTEASSPVSTPGSPIGSPAYSPLPQTLPSVGK